MNNVTYHETNTKNNYFVFFLYSIKHSVMNESACFKTKQNKTKHFRKLSSRTVEWFLKVTKSQSTEKAFGLPNQVATPEKHRRTKNKQKQKTEIIKKI